MPRKKPEPIPIDSIKHEPITKVYIETSVVSYLTARRSTDVIILGHQQITQEWWALRKKYFGLYISQLVRKEASAGDAQAAAKRLAILQDIALLQSNNKVIELAQQIVLQNVLPKKAADDAIHIALATIHQMDYLLTWNCKHIANAELQKAISKICHQRGYEKPILCTPEELMGK
jgi:hypothetical protein